MFRFIEYKCMLTKDSFMVHHDVRHDAPSMKQAKIFAKALRRSRRPNAKSLCRMFDECLHEGCYEGIHADVSEGRYGNIYEDYYKGRYGDPHDI